MKSFGNKLKELRNEKGITQKTMSEHLKISVPTLSHWECDYQEPAFKDLIMLSQFFDVTADYLLGLTSDDDAKLYSAPTASTMGDVHSSKELQLLEIYRNLSPDMQATLWSLLETWNPSTHKNKV